MPLPLSVIIPALDEEARITAAIESAFAAGAGEVIVCDGGSSDGTAAVAARAGARIVKSDAMRSIQMNGGADASQFPNLIFLHGDTTLPPDGGRAVCDALASGILFGGFRVRFAERSLRLRIAAAMINIRTFFTRCPWGDQAQFIRRETFFATGAFLPMSLLEDYEMAIRMKRRGRTRVLPLHVVTSGRRFLQRGVLATAFLNWRIVFAYRAGADVDALAAQYRRRS
jgi:rSAM/selenodomain-associated transferase 2